MGGSIYGKTQCIVNINPQSSTTFCNGDSVILIASASDTTASTLDQYNVSTSTTYYSYGISNSPIWQSFTPAITGTLTKVQLRIGSAGAAGILKIYQGVGLGGTLLYTSSSFNVPPSSYLPITVNAPVVSGMQYTFAATISGSFSFYLDSPGTYSGGVYMTTSNDLFFRTYVAPTNVISYLWSNGSTLSTIVADSSGTYSVAITTSLGCNSSDTVIVTETSVNTSVSQSGVMLTANDTGASYQWINCNGNIPISVATNQSFTATTDGNYAVIITQNSCSDTSSCYNISTTNIVENSFASTVIIYPNPSTGKFKIDTKITKGEIAICNVMGEKIYSTSNLKTSNEINLSNSPKGIYFVKIYDGEKIHTRKIVVQ